MYKYTNPVDGILNFVGAKVGNFPITKNAQISKGFPLPGGA